MSLFTKFVALIVEIKSVQQCLVLFWSMIKTINKGIYKKKKRKPLAAYSANRKTTKGIFYTLCKT